MLSVGKLHGKIIPDPVSFLRGDFTRLEGLADHVGEDIFFRCLFFSGGGFIDVFNSRLKAETEEFLGACRVWRQRIKSGDAAEMDYIIWLRKRKGEICPGQPPDLCGICGVCAEAERAHRGEAEDAGASVFGDGMPPG